MIICAVFLYSALYGSLSLQFVLFLDDHMSLHSCFCMHHSFAFISQSSFESWELSSFTSLNGKTAEATVNVMAIKASLHLPFDHNLLVQNLTVQVTLGILKFWRI